MGSGIGSIPVDRIVKSIDDLSPSEKGPLLGVRPSQSEAICLSRAHGQRVSSLTDLGGNRRADSPRLAPYLLLQPAGEYFQKKIDETEDDRAKECREKALDAEAGDMS